MSPVRSERDGAVLVVTIDRPEARNAVDRATADELSARFDEFEAQDELAVAILTGAGETFCAGADLVKARGPEGSRIEPDGDGPLGPTRRLLAKPVIAAIEGYAVAGGLELAIWCDLRVAARDAILGVFCRRFGVPLLDGGTVRLPRLVGMGRALDLILTGRAVGAEEALAMGLVNRVVDPGRALETAIALAQDLARLPWRCLRSDRRSAYEQWSLPLEAGIAREFELGRETIRSGETAEGIGRFATGEGRHGGPVDGASR